MKVNYLALIPLILASQLSTANVLRENSNATLKTVERFFTVKYKSGQTDRFVYVFTAHLTAYMEELGHPARPPKYMRDTRACNYRVGSYIQRDGFFLTAGGKRVSLNEVNKVYGAGSRAYKDDSVIEQLFGKHSPCNDFTGVFESQKSSIRAKILQDFDTLMVSDLFNSSVAEAEGVIGEAVLEPINQ